MSKEQQLPLPNPQPVIRENGDAVVELRQNGELVGEINFSAILGQWFDQLGWVNRRPKLKSV